VRRRNPRPRPRRTQFAVDSDGATNAAPEPTDSPQEAKPTSDDVAQEASAKPDDALHTHKATRPLFPQTLGSDRHPARPKRPTHRPVPLSASTPPQDPTSSTPLRRKRRLKPPYPARVGSRIPWADLIRFCFREDLTVCPKCGGRMILIAAIGAVQADVVSRVLTHPSPVSPSTGPTPPPLALPPQLDLCSTQRVGLPIRTTHPSRPERDVLARSAVVELSSAVPLTPPRALFPRYKHPETEFVYTLPEIPPLLPGSLHQDYR